MKNFFLNVLATIVGFFLAQILVMIFFFSMIAGLSSGISGKFGGKEITKVEPNSILHLNFSGDFGERSSDDPFESFDFETFEPKVNLGLNEILKNIEKAESDEDIKGIYLEMSGLPHGLATIEALRGKLIEFKESGKFIVAYGEMVTQKSYFLASVADEVYLHPKGFMEFRGLGTRLAFFKNMLDRLGIDMQVFRAGSYKSAVEPFIRNDLSEANREQISSILNDIWGRMLVDMSGERGIDTASLNRIADEFQVQQPGDAVRAKMVDGLLTKDKLIALLKSKTGAEADDELKMITLGKYANSPDGKIATGEKIAVVYAEGAIVDGKGGGDGKQIASKPYGEVLRKLREDDDIKAIVLRVNSGGGSALASEVIWREMTLAKDVKPVIVSMGDVAASGGYYIACNADKILAENSTITGSIGVFGMMPNMDPFWNDKVGITFDEVKTNEYALMGLLNELSADERALIEHNIDTVYETFVGRVAKGRGMSTDEVKSLAGGRIWTGQQALQNGLVDQIGGLEDAIALAASEAGLEDYKIRSYPKQDNPFKMMLSGGMAQVREHMVKTELGPLYSTYVQAKQVVDMNGVQAIMPYKLEIN